MLCAGHGYWIYCLARKVALEPAAAWQSIEESEMSKQVVLITGALTGIGRATAFAFAADGAQVVLSGRQEDKGQALVAELQAKGAQAAFVRADVRYEADVAALVDQVIERFGRLDVAVNNAGKDAMCYLADVTPEAFTEAFDTNVLGTLLSLKHEFRAMKGQKKGAIINVGSVFGHKGYGAGGSIYVGSKFAIEGITKSIALEVAAHGIRVNAVAPGPIETAMFQRVVGTNEEAKKVIVGAIPVGRVGQPEEIANAIVFIASDKAAFMTGEIVTIDGGLAAM
jgi:NAD(P)-dependent dehydrogenase (short-subunit alcohol dehydrogenase family)